jgi:hypothetical protein
MASNGGLTAVRYCRGMDTGMSRFRFCERLVKTYPRTLDPLVKFVNLQGIHGPGMRELFQLDLCLQKLIRVRVESARMPASDSNIAIRTSFPGLRIRGAIRHIPKVRGATDRIRNRCKEDIRLRLSDVTNGGLDI